MRGGNNSSCLCDVRVNLLKYFMFGRQNELKYVLQWLVSFSESKEKYNLTARVMYSNFINFNLKI